MTEMPSIVIVGGGPVGSVLALALQNNHINVAVNINITMLEARAKGAAHSDQRALALSFGSRMLLEQLGVWQHLQQKATAINTIHISQKGSFGRTKLEAKEHHQPALGYVLAYGDLSAALDEALSHQPQVQILYEAVATKIEPNMEVAKVSFKHANTEQHLTTQLAVLADGGRSLEAIAGMTRETKAYGHDALVTKVKCELPHNNIAYERFTAMGPVALLPNGERDFSLVWTAEQHKVAELLALDDASFLKSLHHHFGDRVGRFLQVDKRLSFPLKMASLKPTFAPHLVVIGNAAQTMHPVAGQGFNVGLRDASTLSRLINNQTGGVLGFDALGFDALGSESMLKQYHALRSKDTKRGLMFTDFLVKLFSNDIVGVSASRAAALGLLDVLKPVKSQLVRKMSFGQ